MQTLTKTQNIPIITLNTADMGIDDLLNTEWLLTNHRGGYSYSTVIGCNTRRYHGLLVGALNPPANRTVALSNLGEMIIAENQKSYNLSTFEFSQTFSPAGYEFIKSFRKDAGVHFKYRLDKEVEIELTKSVYLLDNSDTVVVAYNFSEVREPIDFILRPFVGLRDFHSLQKSYAQLKSDVLGGSIAITHDMSDNCRLFLNCDSMRFESDPRWWFNFIYRQDRRRGQGFDEDLWTPGFYKCRIDRPGQILFRADLCDIDARPAAINIDEKIKQICQYKQNIISTCKSEDKVFQTLCLAADDFVVRRQCKKNTSEPCYTILAGYPWFADWGRDAFISLPGLLLCTGRFEQAKSVLTTFAAAADKGMIPNRFDDNSNTAYFNSIDASLWFINASFEYLRTTGDTDTFRISLLSTIRWIIDSYYNGTRFDTHADSDCLITSGDANTQLTWMDAKYQGQAFTPRHGKAVEINALWYNSFCLLAQFYAGRDIEASNHYCDLAETIKLSFVKLFWNESLGYLNDCVLGDGTVDASLRPNQVFAVSLPYSPLTEQQQKAVVTVIKEKLLTPFGIRTLDPADKRYIGRYDGPQSQRDAAYHQGTVWPYLIGHFVQAYLKINNFSKNSKADAAGFIAALVEHLNTTGCLGSIAEIFDGDPPQKPKGCFAQAWSVAEIIRAYKLINE